MSSSVWSGAIVRPDATCLSSSPCPEFAFYPSVYGDSRRGRPHSLVVREWFFPEENERSAPSQALIHLL